MKSKNQSLSLEQDWDDSVLIDSWNQALEEYKKYHSIHAKGGTIDDLEKEQEKLNSPIAKQEETNGVKEEVPTATMEEDQIQEENESEPMDESDETSNPTISDTQLPAEKKVIINEGGGSVHGGWPATTGHGPGPGPQMLLGTVQDEELKKLLMSWYYAGYYTGLYEGKQKGLQEAEQARKT
ncbi:survival motor neuron-like protein 1 [Podospora fimiseda]|uniref:Survival motor neuron-like protein 1 n=1 Tax=Podospora fimiseda TaxID=252190 RepID=A0AAN7GT83_9PEZI|nr:survival motor neuron-like protein 1 [Podospora fimiseda]